MFRDEINIFSERRLNRMSDEQAEAIAVACVRIALMCEKNGATDVEHLKLLDKVERCVEDPSVNTLSWDDIVAYQEYLKRTNAVQAHHAAWVCYGVHFEKDLPRYLSISQAISDCAGAAYLAEMAGMDMTEVRDLFKQAVAPNGVSWS